MTTIFTNARLCIDGMLTSPSDLTVSSDSGVITNISQSGTSTAHTDEHAHVIDLDGAILAPGFLELQTNGLRGFHFTHFDDEESYAKKLDEVARYLPRTGVTGFWATLPTISSEEFRKILPLLQPRDIEGGASLLGAHAEGPYLHPSKKGAHNSSLFHVPSTAPTEVYGPTASTSETLKLVTLAPELPAATILTRTLSQSGICVSLGHSSATFAQGQKALEAGATCLTHTLNAMAPLHHRDPGLAGLVTVPASAGGVPSPYFSIIPDGNHLHPSVASLLFRANPAKCIVITDSIELAGLPDGTYPGHSQIPHNQTKIGSRVVIEGTETLIGGCAGLDECVRNLVGWSGCTLAEGVRCVGKNIAEFMGEEGRGRLEIGSRADLVVLGQDGRVKGTWIGGRKVWDATEGDGI